MNRVTGLVLFSQVADVLVHRRRSRSPPCPRRGQMVVSRNPRRRRVPNTIFSADAARRYFHARIDRDRHVGNGSTASSVKSSFTLRANSATYCLISDAGFGSDAPEIIARERISSTGSAAGPAAREAGLARMKRARRDEQDMIGLHRSVCRDGAPSISGSRSRCTPSRETSAPMRAVAAGDLVDLVEEDDAVLLDRPGSLPAPPDRCRAACQTSSLIRTSCDSAR